MSTHRVVMRSTLTGPDGAPVVHEAVDPRVSDDQIETYLTDARTRWAEVTSGFVGAAAGATSVVGAVR